jgi:hypothetical protein
VELVECNVGFFLCYCRAEDLRGGRLQNMDPLGCNDAFFLCCTRAGDLWDAVLRTMM